MAEQNPSTRYCNYNCCLESASLTVATFLLSIPLPITDGCCCMPLGWVNSLFIDSARVNHDLNLSTSAFQQTILTHRYFLHPKQPSTLTSYSSPCNTTTIWYAFRYFWLLLLLLNDTFNPRNNNLLSFLNRLSTTSVTAYVCVRLWPRAYHARLSHTYTTHIP